MRVTAVMVACAGLFAAGVLSASHVLGLPVACGGSLNCVTVATHPSSRFLGVPVAFFGVAAYLTLLYLLGRSNFDRRTRLTVAGIAAAGTLVSVGLLIYSQTVIRATCSWCIASGIAMTLELLLLGILLPGLVVQPVRWLQKMTWGMVILTAVAVGGQAVQMERAASAPPIAADRLAGVPASELVETGHDLGPADAPVSVVVFADLLCHPCGKVLGELANLQQAHPKGIRIVYRHLPLTMVPGHETSREAAIFSEMAAEMGKFWPFVQAVHGRRGQKNRDAYMDILRIFGADPLESAARVDQADDKAATRVQCDLALAERLGIESTPAIFVRIGSRRPISVSQRNLARVLSSPEVVALLAPRGV